MGLTYILRHWYRFWQPTHVPLHILCPLILILTLSWMSSVHHTWVFFVTSFRFVPMTSMSRPPVSMQLSLLLSVRGGAQERHWNTSVQVSWHSTVASGARGSVRGPTDMCTRRLRPHMPGITGIIIVEFFFQSEILVITDKVRPKGRVRQKVSVLWKTKN